MRLSLWNFCFVEIRFFFFLSPLTLHLLRSLCVFARSRSWNLFTFCILYSLFTVQCLPTCVHHISFLFFIQFTPFSFLIRFSSFDGLFLFSVLNFRETLEQESRSPVFWCVKLLLQASRHVGDLFEDLRDGHNLISLLEVLSGEHLVSILKFFLFVMLFLNATQTRLTLVQSTFNGWQDEVIVT